MSNENTRGGDFSFIIAHDEEAGELHQNVAIARNQWKSARGRIATAEMNLEEAKREERLAEKRLAEAEEKLTKRLRKIQP